ncbi:unnamed protein product [Schistosoma mattheei]|uniref:Secreted protein n=2 Tax=Schistosoma TaxID=6181 RepID=A0A183JQU8_9TREM|nr:unnamed protein product [Schistosoma mattheei]VDO92989.1 unnamed protein product [Schistosoma curassoni]
MCCSILCCLCRRPLLCYMRWPRSGSIIILSYRIDTAFVTTRCCVRYWYRWAT